MLQHCGIFSYNSNNLKSHYSRVVTIWITPYICTVYTAHSAPFVIHINLNALRNIMVY